jgi:hypothetical protein
MGHRTIIAEQNVIIAIEALYHVDRVRHLFTSHETAKRFLDHAPLELDRSREPALGAASSEPAVSSLERQLKVKLPPSYRAFLKHADGWRNYGWSRLHFLSADELRASKLRVGDKPRRDAFVICQDSLAREAVYYLDLKAPAVDGEHAVVRHKDYRRYPSFLALLVAEFEGSAQHFASTYGTRFPGVAFADG